MIRQSVSKKFAVLIIPIVCCAIPLSAQEIITLDSVYIWAEKNYPLIKRADLVRQSESYTLANIRTGNYPQLNITGQASYQSDVTQLPHIPNQPILYPVLSKDQYKIAADLYQNIYDGGSIHAQKQIQKANTQVELASIQKDLYLIREKLNQIYFGVLLLNIQHDQIDSLITQLSRTKIRVESAIENGAAFRSDADQVQAEILTQRQRQYEIESASIAYLQMLSAYTGRQITSDQQLTVPVAETNWLSHENNRPELKLFAQQEILLDQQMALTKSKSIPRISLFGQGGYGLPGLNMLKNEFAPYYVAGLRLNWNFSSLYTNRNEIASLELKKQETAVNREIFLFNNNFSVIQQDNERLKMDQLLNTDEEIVRLKESITRTAEAKYTNGVITLNDLLKEINTLSQARLNMELHKIQSLSNQFNRQFTLGQSKL
ncbi:TolC family protein [Pollutibacter soli]|uniref:TolC family protein n=1 Tax=Pollutibacter soli TaxID=3034157 RepID=UPI0030141A96